MSFSKLYPPKGEKVVANTVYETWLIAKKAGDEKLMAFFADLYHVKEIQPYWDNIFQVLKEKHAEENLEFFAANLERMNDEEFSLQKWKAFYEKWIGDDNIPLINISDTEFRALRDLNEEISKKYKSNEDIINFKNTHVKYAELASKPKIYTGNHLLQLMATKLLVNVNNDKFSELDAVLKEEKTAKAEKAEKKK